MSFGSELRKQLEEKKKQGKKPEGQKKAEGTEERLKGLPTVTVNKETREKAVRMAEVADANPAEYAGIEGFDRLSKQFGLTESERTAVFKMVPKLRRNLVWKDIGRNSIERTADAVYVKLIKAVLPELPAKSMSDAELEECVDRLLKEKRQTMGVPDAVWSLTINGAKRRFLLNFKEHLKEKKILA